MKKWRNEWMKGAKGKNGGDMELKFGCMYVLYEA